MDQQYLHTDGRKAGAPHGCEPPPAETTRWVARRKAQLVRAVQGGRITLDEACHRYALSMEEFRSWEKAIARDGVHGLRASRLGRIRNDHAES